MRRVSVVGCSGAGKSTIAAALAARLGVVHLELDSLYHQAGWTQLEPEEFCRRAGEVTAQEGWVIDGNYGGVRDSLRGLTHVGEDTFGERFHGQPRSNYDPR